MSLVGGAVARAGEGGAANEAQKAVERLAALVDYVAADYPGAVKNGRVIAESELAEQQGMLAEAEALIAKARPLPGHQLGALALLGELGALLQDFRAHASEDKVAADCRTIHKRLIDDYGLVLSPLAPPSEERARAVFAAACASCHGSDGRADTPQARTLKPPPVSFLDGERMSRISPSLAFHALTFGVGGTAMASFDTLPASDRWSLAFYVVGLRHASGELERGARLAAEGRVPIAASASRLAELSDAQLDEKLRSTLPDTGDRAAAIAHLRRVASFAAAPGGDFAEARRILAEVAVAADDPARARSLAVAAYLEGVEPHEATLRARDRAVADRIERAFFELRQAIDGGRGAEQIRREVARAALVLDGAEERGHGGPSVPFFAALAIALREGFELSLLIAALLAFVRKSSRAAEGDARWVHVGWTLAIPAGVATWFLVGAAIGGARRELTEGVLTLVAAAMLLFVSHFVLGRLESRRWLKFLERKVTGGERQNAAPEPRAGHAWSLAAVAFVAAYREAIEIVLFFRALVLDAPGRGLAILAGAATGIAALIALVKVMSILGRRLNPRPLMLVSSVLLTGIAISLVGQGVRALQEGGYLHLSPLPFAMPSVPVLGLYATVEGLAAQLIVLALVIVPAWLEKRGRARAQNAKLA
ncbi:MAG TPA: FTR1 family protein [Polyangia bacterium]|nr:FTR1 family protein [Polyangia bacterium]